MTMTELILLEVGGETKVNVVPAFACALVRGGEDAQGYWNNAGTPLRTKIRYHSSQKTVDGE